MASQSAMKKYYLKNEYKFCDGKRKLKTKSMMGAESLKQNLWWREKIGNKSTSFLGFMGFAWVRGGKAQSGKRQNYASTFYFD